MTAQLTASIGASVKLPGNNAFPVGLSFRGSSKSSGFAAQINQKLQDLSAGSDILSQLAGLLQSGTPMATIVDKVSTELSKAIAKASGKGDDVDAQRTLQRALANALAPPGTSPPSDFQTQVATLVQQVNDILTKLTSQLNTAGQKSEFSGQVLDAEKARELPAQQTNPTTGSNMPAAMAPFVQSLFQRVAAQLQSAQPEKTQQVSAITTPALPDPLARILARAANANVQRGGEPIAKPAAPTSNGTPASSTLFQRLIAIIAERSGTQSEGNAGKESQDRSFGSSGSSTPATQTQSSVQAASGFASQITSAPATPVHSPPASATPYTAIDPQSVIEQVVKGIVIRTSGGTSELRMRLQPENLGDVSLKITVNGNTINANIVAQNADVRDTLLANQQQLARTLSEAGLSLGNFSVDVSGGNAGFTDQRAQQQQPKLSRIGAFSAALDGENDTWAESRYGPPVLSGSKALVLNYLA